MFAELRYKEHRHSHLFTLSHGTPGLPSDGSTRTLKEVRGEATLWGTESPTRLGKQCAPAPTPHIFPCRPDGVDRQTPLGGSEKL